MGGTTGSAGDGIGAEDSFDGRFEERPLERPDLPQTHLDDEEYDEFVRTELEGEEFRPSPPSKTSILMIVGFVLAVAVLLALLMTARK